MIIYSLPQQLASIMDGNCPPNTLQVEPNCPEICLSFMMKTRSWKNLRATKNENRRSGGIAELGGNKPSFHISFFEGSTKMLATYGNAPQETGIYLDYCHPQNLKNNRSSLSSNVYTPHPHTQQKELWKTDDEQANKKSESYVFIIHSLRTLLYFVFACRTFFPLKILCGAILNCTYFTVSISRLLFVILPCYALWQ